MTDQPTIQRFTISDHGWFEKDPSGDLVYYDDHLAALARAEKEREEYAATGVAIGMEERRKEVEKLRAERDAAMEMLTSMLSVVRFHVVPFSKSVAWADVVTLIKKTDEFLSAHHEPKDKS